jgi:hypothetical protein
MPHSLEVAVMVEVQEGYLEVTIQVKKDFTVDGLDADEFHTIVFYEAPNYCGFLYDGKRYEYNEDVFIVLANACALEDVELEKAILMTPLSSPERLADRKERFKKERAMKASSR